MNNITKPLADRIRPTKIDEVVGQEHLLGEGKILNKIIKSGKIPNMIFFGPPGVGKTTVANIIANSTNKNLYKLNATHSSINDIKDIIRDLNNLMNLNGIVLYLDEIQNFNKKQQQSLLEFIENGKITLIASTAENPFMYVYKAIISRSLIMEFKPIDEKSIIKALVRAINFAQKDFTNVKIKYDDNALKYLAQICNGDLRRAINIIDSTIYSLNYDAKNEIYINVESIKECSQCKVLNYDNNGDSHYDILSAFQKSIRGSDVDASIHYLARLIKGGDLISICRRLVIIACEDIGMAYPSAISIVKSCVDSALMVGLPEARIPLSQAVILLATAPKSNSCIKAIDKALNDLDTINTGEIPDHLKDSHFAGADKIGRGKSYKYPHDFKNNYVYQQYLPDNIKNSKYYKPGDNKIENNIKAYWAKIKGKYF